MLAPPIQKSKKQLCLLACLVRYYSLFLTSSRMLEREFRCFPVPVTDGSTIKMLTKPGS